MDVYFKIGQEGRYQRGKVQVHMHKKVREISEEGAQNLPASDRDPDINNFITIILDD